MSNIYLSDNPVENERNDKFARSKFSKRIAQTIINRTNPSGITIGIYGQWGEGKTTVLNFIKQELSKDEHTIILNFSPWRYTDEENLLKSFLEKLLH